MPNKKLKSWLFKEASAGTKFFYEIKSSGAKILFSTSNLEMFQQELITQYNVTETAARNVFSRQVLRTVLFAGKVIENNIMPEEIRVVVYFTINNNKPEMVVNFDASYGYSIFTLFVKNYNKSGFEFVGNSQSIDSPEKVAEYIENDFRETENQMSGEQMEDIKSRALLKIIDWIKKNLIKKNKYMPGKFSFGNNEKILVYKVKSDECNMFLSLNFAKHNELTIKFDIAYRNEIIHKLECTRKIQKQFSNYYAMQTHDGFVGVTDIVNECMKNIMEQFIDFFPNIEKIFNMEDDLNENKQSFSIKKLMFESINSIPGTDIVYNFFISSKSTDNKTQAAVYENTPNFRTLKEKAYEIIFDEYSERVLKILLSDNVLRTIIAGISNLKNINEIADIAIGLEVKGNIFILKVLLTNQSFKLINLIKITYNILHHQIILSDKNEQYFVVNLPDEENYSTDDEVVNKIKEIFEQPDNDYFTAEEKESLIQRAYKHLNEWVNKNLIKHNSYMPGTFSIDISTKEINYMYNEIDFFIEYNFKIYKNKLMFSYKFYDERIENEFSSMCKKDMQKDFTDNIKLKSLSGFKGVSTLVNDCLETMIQDFILHIEKAI